MGRNANTLTGTQKNKTRFEQLKGQIKLIGVRKLGSYGLISHETINNYCTPLAVERESEDKIFLSIRAHEELEWIEEQESIKRSGVLLSTQPELSLA